MAEDFVLVHGGWHGGWAWRGVRSALQAAGHQVSAPTAPGLGIDDDPRDITLADCVDALVDHVLMTDRAGLTLVGHGWGGYVIAGAAPRIAERLKRLVFHAAIVPTEGRSLADELPAEQQAQLRERAADDSVALPLSLFADAFLTDADAATVEVVHRLLLPQPARTLTDPPVGGEAYRSLGIPMHYVLGSEDMLLPPGEGGWARFPAALGVEAVAVPGSHEALFTRPVELAAAFTSLPG